MESCRLGGCGHVPCCRWEESAGRLWWAPCSRQSPRRSLSPPVPLQVKRAVVQVISAMAHHGYLEQPGGEAMMEYLVRQCALPSEAVRVPRGAGQAGTSRILGLPGKTSCGAERCACQVALSSVCADLCLPPLSQQPKKQPLDADDLTSDSVQSISVNTLFLLSTTVDRMNNVSVHGRLHHWGGPWRALCHPAQPV